MNAVGEKHAAQTPVQMDKKAKHSLKMMKNRIALCQAEN